MNEINNKMTNLKKKKKSLCLTFTIDTRLYIFLVHICLRVKSVDATPVITS